MTTKIAVSLPDEQVEAARAAVAEGRAPSVSSYVSQALARRSAEEELLELLDEDEAHSPSTEEHREWARRALQDAPAAAVAPRRRVRGKSARDEPDSKRSSARLARGRQSASDHPPAE